MVRCLPHARGGVSPTTGAQYGVEASSPRPWGCFHHVDTVAVDGWVFPTPVGVFLLLVMAAEVPGGLPHARGGVSKGYASLKDVDESSPRPWGCFLRIAAGCQEPPGLPHARGGVSAL